MAPEWYIAEHAQKTYLHNKPLTFQAISCAEGDHRHCELCWARFSKYPVDLQNGYYEPESKSWICPDCYREFAALFGWTAE